MNKTMLLSFSRVVFLIVHSCLLSIIAALPATQTTTAVTQTHETETKQTRIPVEVNTSKFGVSDYEPSTMGTKEGTFSDVEDKKDEKLRACRVANLTYQHREQIPRSDPCEVCVCVDSEIYCLWKLCNFFKSTTTTTTPLPTAAPSNSQPTTKQSVYDNKLFLEKSSEEDSRANEIETSNEKYSKILTDRRKYNVLKKLQTTIATTTTASTTPLKISPTTEKINNTKPETTTTEPIVCYVMGVMYKYGEVLPRDTGTCLECSCSEGGRVTCSPKDCVSQPDLDYLSHNNNLDMFDLDTF